MKKSNLQVAVVGTMQTNCYLLTNTETKETLIVDPGDSGDRIAAYCLQEKLRPVAILLSHGHFDHISGVKAIQDAFRLSVYAAEAEEALLSEPGWNLSAKYQGYSVSLVPEVLLADGEEFELAGFAIKAIHTPGHTAGGMSYYLADENILFSGDTLFRHTYGRTDLPTSSFEELKHSLREKLFALPEDTEVYPGHGNATTIKEERRKNPVLGD